jgi:starvation-inducible DNA-binding protein
MTKIKPQRRHSPSNSQSSASQTHLQSYTVVEHMPIALAESARREGVENLRQLSADLMTLRDLYKKHHWQASGPTFYQLHLLFDKHYGEQAELVDLVAERIQTLGGVSLAMAHDVAETTLIPRAPRDRESSISQLHRLLHAHEIILEEARSMARDATQRGDDGTNDLIVSSVIRTNELQVWFIASHPAGATENGTRARDE